MRNHSISGLNDSSMALTDATTLKSPQTAQLRKKKRNSKNNNKKQLRVQKGKKPTQNKKARGQAKPANTFETASANFTSNSPSGERIKKHSHSQPGQADNGPIQIISNQEEQTKAFGEYEKNSKKNRVEASTVIIESKAKLTREDIAPLLPKPSRRARGSRRRGSTRGPKFNTKSEETLLPEPFKIETRGFVANTKHSGETRSSVLLDRLTVSGFEEQAEHTEQVEPLYSKCVLYLH